MTRAFTVWLAIRLAANIGGQIQLAALGWSVWRGTGDPLDLAWLGLAQFLPVLLLSLVAGAVADRFDRRLILGAAVAGQGTVCVVAAGLLASAPPSDLTVAGIGLAMGSLRAFSAPASQSLLPALVPADQLSRALATGSMAWQLATIVGPSVAGLLIAAGAGGSGALAVAAALQLLGGALALALPAMTALPRRAVSWDELLAGLRYVYQTKILLATVSLDLFAVLLGGATALLPAFASDVLHVGPEGFGLLRAAPAVGAGAMAFWLSRSPVQRHAGPKVLAAVAAFGVATVVFGASTSFPLSLVALALLGAADMISVVVRQTLVQLRTPDEVRGRVSAVNLVFIGASNELGEFESGVAAKLFGLVPAVVGGGLATLGVVAVWSGLFPDLRKADRLQ